MMDSGLYMANPQLVGGETVQGGLTIQKECKTIGNMTEANELDRDFPKKELAPESDNLVIGSSIIGKLEIDKLQTQSNRLRNPCVSKVQYQQVN